MIFVSCEKITSSFFFEQQDNIILLGQKNTIRASTIVHILLFFLNKDIIIRLSEYKIDTVKLVSYIDIVFFF